MQYKKTSFLGEIIFIIVLVLFVYLFMNQVKTSDIKTIQKINNKYGITKNNLVPNNHLDYIAELNNINSQYSKPIINFVNFIVDTRDIPEAINLTILNEKKCISKKLRLKIITAPLNQKEAIHQFESIKKNKQLNKINWDSYIQTLKLNTQLTEIKTEALDVPVCKN